MEQAETGDAGEMGNFSYNEDVLDVSSSFAVDHSKGDILLCSSLLVCSSNSEGMI